MDPRLVRVLLPAALVARAESIVTRPESGYPDFSAFVRDAVEQRLLEIEHGGATDAVAPDLQAAPQSPGIAPALEMRLAEPDRVLGSPDVWALSSTVDAQRDAESALEATTLHYEPFDYVAHTTPELVDEDDRRQMFGIHNRDYPSIWALHRLSLAAADGPVPLDDFREDTAEEARRFAREIAMIELTERQPLRLGIMFPRSRDTRATNTRREPLSSSAETFKSIAIGGAQRRRPAPGEPFRYRAVGPLPDWRVMAIIGAADSSTHQVAVTEAGRTLLEALDGLSLRLPHSLAHATAFLDHLRRHDPADLEGFKAVLDLAGKSVDRSELVEGYAEWFDEREPGTTGSSATTNAQGYISRAREWGLIAPKLIDRRYELTAAGAEVLSRFT